MSSSSHHHRTRSSRIYTIYRRLRFVRYKKKLARQVNEEAKKEQLLEQQKHIQELREFRISEKKKHQLKLKADKEESRKLKKELKQEIRTMGQAAKEEFGRLSIEDRKNRQALRKAEKLEQRRLKKLGRKLAARNFFGFFRSINAETVKYRYREFRDKAPSRRLFALTSFNSTLLFLLSYFALFFISQIITVITAKFFNYPTSVYYYEIYFNISSEAWFHDSVKTIFSSGPIVSFVVGIIFLIIYSNMRENPGPSKAFFLWGFLHGVNMLFGALLVGTLFETGVGHVISWLYISDSGKVLYSIVSIFLLVISGLVATKPFLISANSYHPEINKYNRTSFILAQVLMPYLAGNVFLFILRQPRFVFYDTFIALSLIISILPVMITYLSYHELFFEEEEKKPGITWLGLGLLGLAVLIFRGLLGIGIHFSG
jgi:hypothetical protein